MDAVCGRLAGANITDEKNGQGHEIWFQILSKCVCIVMMIKFMAVSLLYGTRGKRCEDIHYKLKNLEEGRPINSAPRTKTHPKNDTAKTMGNIMTETFPLFAKTGQAEHPAAGSP